VKEEVPQITVACGVAKHDGKPHKKKLEIILSVDGRLVPAREGDQDDTEAIS
jgi:hypothetical protein